MQPSLQQETDRLVRSWGHHAPEWLAGYLVAGVEDPRINLQSILSRHLIIGELFGDRFGSLMAEEYRFSACMNWLMKLVRRAAPPEEMAAVLFALKQGSDNAEGLEIPRFLLSTFAQLPAGAAGRQVPNYIEEFFADQGVGGSGPRGIQHSLDTLQELWRESLTPDSLKALMPGGPPAWEPRRLSLLEPACGSANDYRFLDAYGLAQWLDYSGFDLCVQNIENARAVFPQTRFRVGNVFEIDASDKAYDLSIVHDLLEHLSIDGMQIAVRELCRVTRRGIGIGFFQMDEIREHVVRPVDEYHWNLLSMGRMRELFAKNGFTAQVIQIGSFLEQQVGCKETHNPNAYSFILRPST